jgi:hypothetical protein
MSSEESKEKKEETTCCKPEQFKSMFEMISACCPSMMEKMKKECCSK